MPSLADWKSKLETLKQSAPSRVAQTGKILSKLRSWLDRYHGGMPLGFLASIVQFESGGNPAAGGDAGLAEYGYLQVAGSTAQTFGLPAAIRLQPEGNLFLGSLEYQLEAVKMHQARPDAVRLGTADSWKLARLAFAIGSPGTKKLLAGVPVGSSQPWRDLVAYVDRIGGMTLGSQEPGKVWYRVHAVDVLWGIGEAVAPSQSVGAPERLPAPAGVAYTLPPLAAPYFSEPSTGLLLAAALAAGVALLVI